MTDDDRRRIGEAIRAIRQARRLNQYDVAKDPRHPHRKNADVSIGTLQMIEKGEGREVRESNIRKVLAFLGTSVEEVLRVEIKLNDPRLENLRNEDFRIARQYHDSDSDVRKQVRTLLHEGESGRWFALLEKLQQLSPSALATVEAAVDELSAVAEERRDAAPNAAPPVTDTEVRPVNHSARSKHRS